MRLWSLHPRFLDRQGLLGLWREALQAKNALLDPQHSSNFCHERQLRRFKSHETRTASLICIGKYLHCVADEMIFRGYKPNVSRIPYYEEIPYLISVTTGQIDFEISHLRKKLEERKASEDQLIALGNIRLLMYGQLNPLFKEVGGEIELWEKL